MRHIWAWDVRRQDLFAVYLRDGRRVTPEEAVANAATSPRTLWPHILGLRVVAWEHIIVLRTVLQRRFNVATVELNQ